MLGYGDPDEALITIFRKSVVECLERYEQVLAKQDFLGGKVRSLVSRGVDFNVIYRNFH